MNVFFAISDAVWQAAIAACVVLIPAYLQYRISTSAKKTIEEVAVRVKDVKDEVSVIHDLTNSGKGSLLRVSATSARALAISEPTATNKALSERADADLQEHDSAQAKADATKKEQQSEQPENTVLPKK